VPECDVQGGFERVGDERRGVSQRVPGAARGGSPAPPVPELADSPSGCLRAAVGVAHALLADWAQNEPLTEPIPRLTASGEPVTSPEAAGGEPAGADGGQAGSAGPAVRPTLTAAPSGAAPGQPRPGPPSGRPRQAAAGAALWRPDPGGAEGGVPSPPAGQPGRPAAGRGEQARPRLDGPGEQARPPLDRPGEQARPPAAGPADRRRPQRGGLAPRRRRLRVTTAGLVAAAVVLTAAGVLAARESSHGASRAPAGVRGPGRSAATDTAGARSLAAAWVVREVSHNAVVACDRAMCSALARRGFPAANLRVLGAKAVYPLTSSLVAETAQVRHLFGTSLAANYAPAILAAVGTGGGRIDIRVIAPQGAAAYRAALTRELSARREAGAYLLRTASIRVSAAAARPLAAGQADSRLLVLLTYLASFHPLTIVRFGDGGPGASEDASPLRFVDLAEHDPAAHMATSAFFRSLLADRATLAGLGPHWLQYRQATAQVLTAPGGQAVLRIEYLAPTPLGLIGPRLAR
jgi:hypothetical protein